MAYLNTVSTDFFAEDLNASPPRFKLYKNQGVANYVDYEVFGVFTGRGALRFESFVYPSTPQRIFRILASSLVFSPLQISDGALKLSSPNGWSGKEVRVKFLTKGEAGSDGYILIHLGGSTNEIIFVIGRQSDQMMSSAQEYLWGMASNSTPPIYFGLNSWYLVDFQAKANFLTNQLILKNVVYHVNLNPDGVFNSLGTLVGVQTLNIPFGAAIPSPNTLWGVNPIEIQGVSGNPGGVWLDNLSIGQGEGITEL
jgi:hypothetical protein